MIALDVVQGSPEWIQTRLGIPTASNFDRLVTPKTGKPSSAADGYLNELLAEWLIGEPVTPDLAGFVERGSLLEPEAIRFYEALTDTTVERVGFCLTDDRRAGASPDGLIGTDGGLELKCPSAAVHVGYLRALREPLRTAHYAQIQGGLWVTGRSWWDFLSYHPILKPVVVRYERDEAFLATLAEIVPAFCDTLDRERAQLAEYRR